MDNSFQLGKGTITQTMHFKWSQNDHYHLVLFLNNSIDGVWQHGLTHSGYRIFFNLVHESKFFLTLWTNKKGLWHVLNVIKNCLRGHSNKTWHFSRKKQLSRIVFRIVFIEKCEFFIMKLTILILFFFAHRWGKRSFDDDKRAPLRWGKRTPSRWGKQGFSLFGLM